MRPNARFKQELDRLIDDQLLPCPVQPALDLVEFDRIAVRESQRLVSAAHGADWDRPTPCDGWTLRRLVSHMTGQHRGFAAAARGEGAVPGVWQDAELGAAPQDAYQEAAEELLRAFAEPGLPEREFRLPEIRDGAPFPARAAVGFHLVDYVVHSWDVAAALGLDTGFPDEVLAAALRVAERVPDDASRRVPGAAFAPSLPVAEGAPSMERVLRLLGRSAEWTAPAAPAAVRSAPYGAR